MGRPRGKLTGLCAADKLGAQRGTSSSWPPSPPCQMGSWGERLPSCTPPLLGQNPEKRGCHTEPGNLYFEKLRVRQPRLVPKPVSLTFDKKET